MPNKVLLQQIDLFSGISNEELDKISTISSTHTYANGSILCYESESDNQILFLISGMIRVYKIDKNDNEIFLYHIHNNSMITEFSSLENNNLSCYSTIEFVEDSIVLSIDFIKFKNYFLVKNRLLYNFINELTLKNRQLHNIIDKEFIYDAISKISLMLVTELDTFNKLKNIEIAKLLHMQPETLSRKLHKLRDKNLIQIIDNKVKILKLKELRKIYSINS